MTLLGVGVSGAGATSAGGNSTLGRIGSGYTYADWFGQIQYQSPNFNGFQVTAAIVEPTSNGVDTNRNNVGYEAKATYDFSANDVNGRIWLGGISKHHDAGLASTNGVNGYTAYGAEIGAKASVAGFGVVGYYYDGKGIDGQLATGGLRYANGFKTDDNGGYVQGTYVLPGVGTKLGVSWGRNTSEGRVGAIDGEIKNTSWIVGAYHPLTKHLNLVAEWTNQEIELDARTTGASANGKVESDTLSAGAILFF